MYELHCFQLKKKKHLQLAIVLCRNFKNITLAVQKTVVEMQLVMCFDLRKKKKKGSLKAAADTHGAG